MKFLERFGQGCSHCHSGEGCGIPDAVSPDVDVECRAQHGVPLALAAALVFVLPLVAALAGAWALPRLSPSLAGVDVALVGGAVAGFLLGVGAARLVFWWVRPRPAVAVGGTRALETEFTEASE